MPIISGENGGGSGFAIGSSYVIAALNASGNKAMGSTNNAALTLSTLVGTDLSVAGSTITIATAGVYIAELYIAPVGAIEAYQVDLGIAVTYNVSGSGLDPAFGGLSVPLVTGPRVVGAGQTVVASVYADNTGSAGTYNFGGTVAERLLVTRLA